MNSSVKFFLQSIATGLMAAALLWLIQPEIFSGSSDNDDFQPTHTSFANAVQKAAPAVVNIYTSKRIEQPISQPLNPLLKSADLLPLIESQPFRAKPEFETSLGSGVIFTKDGYVLTNYHVVQNADSINVSLRDGRFSQARLVGFDRDTDLAVLQIDLGQLPTIPLNTMHPVRIGDIVLAIGNPFGVGQAVSMGVVSATGLNRLGLNTIEDFIQTDAAINPGNSGGALINAWGELVAINSAIYSRNGGGSNGIGFAIPSSLATEVLKQIIQYGRVIRGWLGISARQLEPQEMHLFNLQHGLLVVSVQPLGPADKAGLKSGDILTYIGQEAIYNQRQALDLIARMRPENRFSIQIVRNGENKKLMATAGTRPES
ncbi:S1C family serine protease [Pelagibaculum spongiae]|uniref:Transcriptional regulator n=1 Tax=Pelagibaculum spongiae TaxID=2080658 RepID=A0A2V1H3V2_9GAMM|nr:trypsin-like peptidase domain-containing protein [Pelagibaculum spongiae]PVZ71908.1 transcriptional regulator [Pelagibaculum spongiae]